MGQEYLIFLLGFEVTLRDRRNEEVKGDFTVVAFPEEHPEGLEDAYDTISKNYGRLGFDVLEIKHQKSKVLELDLMADYEASPTLAEYWEE